jgi:hypothetical protein
MSSVGPYRTWLMLELLSAPGASADLRDLAALPVGQISPGVRSGDSPFSGIWGAQSGRGEKLILRALSN